MLIELCIPAAFLIPPIYNLPNYVTVINFNLTLNSMFDSDFELFEVSILIKYLFGPYPTSLI